MAHRHPGFDRRRRLTGALLGGATILTLLVSVLFLELGRGAEPDSTLAAGDTTTTIVSTATSPSTVVTSLRSTEDTVSGTDAPTTSPPSTSAPTSLAATTSPTTVPETTVVETTSPETTVPETTVTTLSSIILESDGLAVVDFGQGVSETVDAVQARLGPATSDSGWVAARGEYGVCPGTAVRVIRWESLRLYFTDGPTDFGEETRHFFYYNQSTVSAEVVIDLTTSAGIGIDSTVDELRRAYAGRLVIESSIPFGVTFYIEADTPGLLSGILTSSSPDGSVTAVSGGFGCGS
jgi:hypothetical protein